MCSSTAPRGWRASLAPSASQEIAQAAPKHPHGSTGAWPLPPNTAWTGKQPPAPALPAKPTQLEPEQHPATHWRVFPLDSEGLCQSNVTATPKCRIKLRPNHALPGVIQSLVSLLMLWCRVSQQGGSDSSTDSAALADLISQSYF